MLAKSKPVQLIHHHESRLFVHHAVFHHRASGQKTSDDRRLPLHGSLLRWDHSVRPPAGTESPAVHEGGHRAFKPLLALEQTESETCFTVQSIKMNV